MNTSTLKHPTAWLPLVMSFVALSLVLVHVGIYGIVHEADEGAAAHIFQLLMAGQLPVVAFFAIKWLPQTPKEAVQVLALQAAALIPPFAAVFFLT